MDANSPLETTEEFNEKDEESIADKVDLNPFKSKEVLHDELKVFSKEEAQYALVESNLVGSSLQGKELDEAEDKTSDDCFERVKSPNKDYVKDFEEDDNLNHNQKSSSDHVDNDGEKYSTPDVGTNGNYDQVSVDPQIEGFEVDKEMDGINLNLNFERDSKMREGDYSVEMATSENGGMVWENSSMQSTQETRNASLSPERRLSISAERSPRRQLPHEGNASPKQDMPSPTKLVAPSSHSSRRRRSPSPANRNLGHKRGSRDHSPPSKRPKSPSERASKREPHHKVDSPKRQLSRSPRKHESPRRRGRSTSKSPMRRRGSRSRSPIARSHDTRSPRRQSPRRRSSPTYHPRQRSSRRPWSPPANRNTGIGRPGKNLFIAGFSYVTTERDLERKFSKFGRVTDVRVVRDKRSGDSRGFGFLSLEKDEDADAAIRAVDQTEWNGRIVLVEKSKTSTR